jgi:hypothetical protein
MMLLVIMSYLTAEREYGQKINTVSGVRTVLTERTEVVYMCRYLGDGRTIRFPPSSCQGYDYRKTTLQSGTRLLVRKTASEVR